MLSLLQIANIVVVRLLVKSVNCIRPLLFTKHEGKSFDFHINLTRWMVRAMRGTIRTSDPSQRSILAAHQRFYTALALHDLAHEVPLSTVAHKFGATKASRYFFDKALKYLKATKIKFHNINIITIIIDLNNF